MSVIEKFQLDVNKVCFKNEAIWRRIIMSKYAFICGAFR